MPELANIFHQGPDQSLEHLYQILGSNTRSLLKDIFGQMHFLLISENEIFHEIKHDGITSLHGIHVYQVSESNSCSSRNITLINLSSKVKQLQGILRHTWLPGVINIIWRYKKCKCPQFSHQVHLLSNITVTLIICSFQGKTLAKNIFPAIHINLCGPNNRPIISI